MKELQVPEKLKPTEKDGEIVFDKLYDEMQETNENLEELEKTNEENGKKLDEIIARFDELLQMLEDGVDGGEGGGFDLNLNFDSLFGSLADLDLSIGNIKLSIDALNDLSARLKIDVESVDTALKAFKEENDSNLKKIIEENEQHNETLDKILKQLDDFDMNMSVEELERLLKSLPSSNMATIMKNKVPFCFIYDVGDFLNYVFGDLKNATNKKIDITVPLMGEKFEIEIPDMFYEYSPFIRGFTRAIIDIGFVFLFVRLVRRGS